MIQNKNDYKEYVKTEENLYREIGYRGRMHSFISQCEVGQIVKFMRVLRKDELYTNQSKKSLFNKLLSKYYRRKHNILGLKLGIQIPINTFEKGLLIYHSQNIIVHKDARCGELCKLHGCNCIGNNGKENSGHNTPIIGKNVDIGVGAIVIGGICIADNTTIAANAVVCKSITDKGKIAKGMPATVL